MKHILFIILITITSCQTTYPSREAALKDSNLYCNTPDGPVYIDIKGELFYLDSFQTDYRRLYVFDARGINCK